MLAFYGDRCQVLTDGGSLSCRLRGRMRQDEGALAAGDRVTFTRLSDSEGLIEEIAPRRNQLQRPMRDRKRRRGVKRQTVLANCDQVVVVTAARQPGIDFFTVDRSLALARAARMAPVLCVTKIDLAGREEMERLLAPYRHVVDSLYLVSNVTGAGIESLRAGLAGKISLFWGKSGVGKSSLIRTITGEEVKTGVWKDSNPRGPHTTNTIRLYPLPDGALIADSPGFDWLDLDEELLESRDTLPHMLLPEVERLGVACEYANCTHRGEPGCGVMNAVLAGRIDAGRFSRYSLSMADLLEDQRKSEAMYVAGDYLLAPARSGRGEDWLHVTLEDLIRSSDTARDAAVSVGSDDPEKPLAGWVYTARDEEPAEAQAALTIRGRLVCAGDEAPLEQGMALLLRIDGKPVALGALASVRAGIPRWKLRKALKGSPLPDIPALWTDLPHDESAGSGGCLVDISLPFRFANVPQLLFGCIRLEEKLAIMDALEIESSDDIGRT